MPRKAEDLKGITFGRLTPVAYLGGSRWQCVCSCGNKSQVMASKLKDRSTVSCGCYGREHASERGGKNATHGMHLSPEYYAWASMHSRCTNPNNPLWYAYGGRGVRVCPEWKDFAVFFKDMGSRPSKGHSLDRIDNGLLYSKATCRWATWLEQGNNTSRNRWITHDGQTRTLAEWARVVGINYQTLFHRVNVGWPIDKALTRPVGRWAAKS